MIQPSQETIQAYIAKTCKKYGVSAEVAIKQCFTESSFRADARNSKSDCCGLFQLSERTAEELDVDRYDWQQNIEGGVKYDALLFHRFGSWDKALAAFDWGMGNVRNLIAKHGDDWRNHLPAETKQYITKILGDGDGHHDS